MGFYQGSRYARQGLDLFVRTISAHIGGERQESDSQQDSEAGTLQIVALRDQGKQEQTAADDIADGRKMVQQEMDMCQAHLVNGERRHAARLLYNTRAFRGTRAKRRYAGNHVALTVFAVGEGFHLCSETPTEKTVSATMANAARPGDPTGSP